MPDEPNIFASRPINKFAIRLSLLASGSILKFGLQLFIIILYAKKLSYLDYGLYQSIWVYVNFFSILSLFGLPALLLSIPVSNIFGWIKNHRKKVFTFGLLLNSFTVGYFFLANKELTEVEKWLSLILIFLQNISLIGESWIIKIEKEKELFNINLLYLSIYAFSHFYFLYSNSYSLTSVLIGIVVATVLKCSLLFINIFGSIQPSIKIIDVGKQWLFLGINDTLSVAVKWLDKWIILLLLPASQFAIYYNGAYEIPIFGLMVSTVGSIMLVEVSKKEKTNLKNIKSLFEHSSLLLSAIVFPSFCFLFFYHLPFFILIFGSKYSASIPVFLISIFILPARIIYSTTVLQVYQRSDLIVKGSIIDLIVAIILMLVLYPFLQMKGLALAFVLSTYIQVGYYLWHTAKIINKKINYFFPFKKLSILMLISFFITGLGYYFFTFFLYPLSLILGIILCMIVSGGILLYYYKKGIS